MNDAYSEIGLIHSKLYCINTYVELNRMSTSDMEEKIMPWMMMSVRSKLWIPHIQVDISFIMLPYVTRSGFPSLSAVDSLPLCCMKHRAFHKSTSSKRANSVPEESASLAQWIPDKDNL